MELELSRVQLRHQGLRIRDRDPRLLAELEAAGQQVPVVVIVNGSEPGQYVLIDGYARVDALRRLGHDTVLAVIWDLPEDQALIHLRQLEEGRRNVIEDAWLLDLLHREHGLSLDELALRFSRSKSWVSRRLGLVGQLGAPLQEALHKAVVPPHAAMKYLLPLARANRTHLERLLEGLKGQKLSVRQVQQLYVGYRVADEAGKTRIVQSPLLFLRTQAEPLGQTAVEPTIATVSKQLQGLAQHAWRVHHAISSPFELERRYGGSRLGRAWQGARAAFEGLCDVLDPLVNDDRQGVSDGSPDAGQTGSEHQGDRSGAGDLA